MIDHSVKTEQPKEIKVGEIYMIMYIGWKKIKVLEVGLKYKKVRVQEFEGFGEPYIVDAKRIKINLL